MSMWSPVEDGKAVSEGSICGPVDLEQVDESSASPFISPSTLKLTRHNREIQLKI